MIKSLIKFSLSKSSISNFNYSKFGNKNLRFNAGRISLRTFSSSPEESNCVSIKAYYLLSPTEIDISNCVQTHPAAYSDKKIFNHAKSITIEINNMQQQYMSVI